MGESGSLPDPSGLGVAGRNYVPGRRVELRLVRARDGRAICIGAGGLAVQPCWAGLNSTAVSVDGRSDDEQQPSVLVPERRAWALHALGALGGYWILWCRGGQFGERPGVAVSAREGCKSLEPFSTLALTAAPPRLARLRERPQPTPSPFSAVLMRQRPAPWARIAARGQHLRLLCPPPAARCPPAGSPTPLPHHNHRRGAGRRPSAARAQTAAAAAAACPALPVLAIPPRAT